MIIGLGCRQGCSCDDLLALIQQALGQAALTLSSAHALASIDLKREEPGLIQLAARFNLPLEVFSAQQLEPYASRLSQHSKVAYEQTGCWGIAESAALALAEQLGGTTAKLIIPRQSSVMATFALACAG
ncbi:cobalamin biosynthesis protein [Pseudomonas sp. SIMBA_077]